MKFFVRIVILFISLNFSVLFGQTGREFWFGIPDISTSLGETPVFLSITALYETDVTISLPADSTFSPITFHLVDMENKRIDLSNYFTLSSYWETQPDGIIQKEGFLITSHPGEIDVNYELDVSPQNREIIPLKGESALGTDFTVSTQNWFDNYRPGLGSFTMPRNGFVIVATEDSTHVRVFPNGNSISGYFPAPPFIDITLNRGQSYAFKLLDALSLGPDHLNGIDVSSDNNIAITIYDDGVYKVPGYYDLFADQLIPKANLGTEYFLQRGTSGDTLDAFIITGTQDGTNILIDGVLETTINKNEVYRYSLPIATEGAVLSSTQPILVTHMVSSDKKIGAAVLPSFESCVGSYEVEYTRSFNVEDAIAIRLIGHNITSGPNKNKTADNFYIVEGNAIIGFDTTKIPFGYFEYSYDESYVYLPFNTETRGFISGIISHGKQVKIYNTLSKFHFGVINGGPATGAKYGYFTNYTDVAPSAGIGGFSASPDTIFCSLDDVRFVASGGNQYVWTSTSDPLHINMLSDDSIAAPIFSPDSSGVYVFNVKISGPCHPDTNVTITIAAFQQPSSNFSVNTYSVCSLDTIVISNTSNTANTDKMIWTFSPPGELANQDTLPNTFPWVFPANNSDTIEPYSITLTSYSPGNYCSDSREKIIFVKPGVEASFTADTTSGCAPLGINFTNNTVSGHDTLIYLWSFGDESYSNQENVVHAFSNNSTSNKTYKVELIAETPYGCIDSNTVDITVLPRVESFFSIDTNYGCSPLTFNVDPTVSIGADSIVWNFDLFYNSSVIGTTTIAPISQTHEDTTRLDGPDTLNVYLVSFNNEGCIDTSSTNTIIVYPTIEAVFNIDKDSICDGDSIKITNLSVGYDPKYEWNFGDNTSWQDSSTTIFKKYFNRTNADTLYTITLNASSGSTCNSTLDTNIIVHPFIKANFGFEYETNCSPLAAQISNTSIQVDYFDWDFGDGTTSDTSVAAFEKIFIDSLPNDDTTYTITLIASNNEGCADTLQRNITLFPEVISDFTILDTTICSPDSVHFQNNSTGSNLSFAWDFGNGLSGTDSQKEFAKYYTNYTNIDSTVDVTLIASNGSYCADTSIHSVEILAFIDANFGIPNNDSCAPFTVRLNNYSSPGAHEFIWDLGPAGVSTDFVPAVLPEYDNDTSYDPVSVWIKLSATSDPSHWGICDDSDSIQVNIYPRLHAIFDLVDSVSCNPFQTSITNNSYPPSGTLYEWYLDDLPYSTKADPGDLKIENFTADSLVQSLWLYGNSKYGCRDTMSKQVVVYPRVNPQFTINKEALCTYDSIYIDRSSSEGGIVTFNWDFNGEDSLLNYSADQFYYSLFDNQDYPFPITKHITLTGYDVKGCSNFWEDSILIYPEIKAGFTIDTQKICYPHTTVFKDTSKNADFFLWEFGDGLSSREDSPEHQYSNFSKILDSIYNPQLIVWSQYDCYDTTTDQIIINARPEADFFFPVTADCPPFKAKMINDSKGDTATLNWFWDFGGGDGTSIEKDPEFIFSNTSNSVITKDIYLSVTSINGCSDDQTKTLTVYPNVDTSFTVTANAGCSPLHVDFSSTADETNIQQILWFSNDDAFSNLTSPSYDFDNALPTNDTIIVKFKVYSIYNCVDSAQVPIIVYPSPTVNFIPDPVTVGYNTAMDQTPITFSNETQYQDVWDYKWDYGDGNSDNRNEQLVTYNYGDQFWGDADNEFKIPVKLTGWNKDRAECSDSITYEIIISPPEPEIDVYNDTSGCQPFFVAFDAYTKYNNEDEYFWEFGIDGETSTEKSPEYTFTEAGSYTVRLTIKGDGGEVSDYKIVDVIPQPKVNFSFNDTIVFVEDDEIIFYNYTEGGIDYAWYFNADNIESGQFESKEFEPYYSYSDTGTFYVGLISSSVENCYDTMIHPQPIRVLKKGVLLFPTAFYVSEDRISDEYSTKQGEGEGNFYLFYPKHVGVSEFNIEIYSRWGTKVFESDDINRGWNGMFDNKLSAQGVYIWRARGRFANGQPFDKSGDVTLLRGNPK